MVRTADEALITVQLMVFFELDDIEKMLLQTHDPIADFINAVTADIIRDRLKWGVAPGPDKFSPDLVKTTGPEKEVLRR